MQICICILMFIFQYAISYSRNIIYIKGWSRAEVHLNCFYVAMFSQAGKCHFRKLPLQGRLPDRGPNKKMTMFEPKPGKSSPAARVHDCNRSGVVELVGREPLMFARFESSAWQNSPRKKNAKILDQKQQFSMGNFHLFGRGKTNFWGGGYNFKTG